MQLSRGQPVIHAQVFFLSFHFIWGGAYSFPPQLDTHYPMTDAVCHPPQGQGAPSNLPSASQHWADGVGGGGFMWLSSTEVQPVFLLLDLLSEEQGLWVEGADR